MKRLWDQMDDDVLLILWHNGRDAYWIARFMCCSANTIHAHDDNWIDLAGYAACGAEVVTT